MNDLQRALADTLILTIVNRRLAGHLLTEREQTYAIIIAIELGLLRSMP